jgi:hypothetical protein
MENLPEKDQSSAFPSLSLKRKKLKQVFLLTLGLLVLIGGGVFYWLKIIKGNETKTIEEEGYQQTVGNLLSEGKFEDAVYRIYGDETLEGTQDIINAFTSIINSHPETILEYAIQYTHYTTIAGSLIGEYYASGGSPEERNQEILEVLAYVREMARENPAFNEENWVVEGIDY